MDKSAKGEWRGSKGARGNLKGKDTLILIKSPPPPFFISSKFKVELVTHKFV